MTEEELEIIREFERVLGRPKPPPPADEESEGYEEYRNEGQGLEAPDEAEIWEAEHRRPKQQERTEQKVLHDEDAQVVHRDNENLVHDKSRIYTEKPLIEEEPIEHVTAAGATVMKQRRITHAQLIQAVKWAEILGKPKAFR